MFLAPILLAAVPFFTPHIELTPGGPTSVAPVAAVITHVDPRIPCAPQISSVKVTGSTVRLDLVRDHCSPSAPRKATYEFGRLNAGQYQLQVFVDGEPYATRSFIVRNGAPTFARVTPFAHVSRTGPGAPVFIDTPAFDLCETDACEGVTVFFGDVPAQPRRIARTQLVVNAPPHPPGLVTVRIRTVVGGGDFSLPAAAYFFDPNDAPDLSVWSRVLFPVLQSSAGAFGTRWTTDAVIRNGNPAVQTFRAINARDCGDACSRFEAGELRKFEGRDHPHGAVLLVPHGEVDAFTFGSRIRDRVREREDFGAEVPVIRERDMRREPFLLLDVPVTADYRSKLRVYVYAPPDVTAAEATVQGLGPAPSAVSLHRVDDTLMYGELDLQGLPQLPGGDRLELVVVPPAGFPTWAFVSVTNNATQRVTLVTPN
jgi:hypothetical protein